MLLQTTIYSVFLERINALGAISIQARLTVVHVDGVIRVFLIQTWQNLIRIKFCRIYSTVFEVELPLHFKVLFVVERQILINVNVGRRQLLEHTKISLDNFLSLIHISLHQFFDLKSLNFDFFVFLSYNLF